MSKKSLARLKDRLNESNRLIEIHTESTGDLPGRRVGYEVLNRSSIVLSVAAWEGFVEDAIGEAVAAIARDINDPSKLPDNVRDTFLHAIYNSTDFKSFNTDVKEKMWSLSGRKWRSAYLEISKCKIKSFNTPNHSNVKKLISSLIGLGDFSSNWKNSSWNKDHYIKQLDLLLIKRHQIAHGSEKGRNIRKKEATDAIGLISNISEWTSASISDHISKLCPKKTLYMRIKTKPPVTR